MPESSASAGSRACALAWRALASAFSTNVACGSSASGDAELGLRDDVDAERREQPAELAQLARVVGREDEARDRHRGARAQLTSPSAARCAAMSVADAALGERRRSASISRARERRALGRALQLDEAAAPVITTFMSVSQPESSA